MRLKIRTLQNSEIEIDVNNEDSVFKLKQKIEEKLPTMEADMQRLIHCGKILKDEQLISDYANLKNDEKLVVMTTKKVVKAAPPAATAAAPPAATAAAAPPAAASAMTGETAAQLQQTTAAATTTMEATTPQTGVTLNYEGAASTLLTGTEVEQMVTSICAMGFDKSKVERAMRAAFFNPDRAVEYLMTDSPLIAVPLNTEGNQMMDVEQTLGDDSGSEAPQGVTMDNERHRQIVAMLERLRQNPRFAEFRAAAQNDPTLLTRVFEILSEATPEAFELIEMNEDMFLNFLERSTMGDAEGEPSPPAGGPPPPGAPQENVLYLSPAEADSIDRLEGLGFSRDVVLMAFVACDRDESMAANFLFEYFYETQEN